MFDISLGGFYRGFTAFAMACDREPNRKQREVLVMSQPSNVYQT